MLVGKNELENSSLMTGVTIRGWPISFIDVSSTGVRVPGKKSTSTVNLRQLLAATGDHTSGGSYLSRRFYQPSMK